MSERVSIDVHDGLTVTIDERGTASWSPSRLTATRVDNEIHDAIFHEYERHTRRMSALMDARTAIRRTK